MSSLTETLSLPFWSLVQAGYCCPLCPNHDPLNICPLGTPMPPSGAQEMFPCSKTDTSHRFLSQSSCLYWTDCFFCCHSTLETLKFFSKTFFVTLHLPPSSTQGWGAEYRDQQVWDPHLPKLKKSSLRSIISLMPESRCFKFESQEFNYFIICVLLCLSFPEDRKIE